MSQAQQAHTHRRRLMWLVVMVVVVVVLMTRRWRRVGFTPDAHIHDVHLARLMHESWRRCLDRGSLDRGWRRRLGGWRRGERRHWLNLLRATNRVAASFAAPSRPTDLGLPLGIAPVAGDSCRHRGYVWRLHCFVPVGLADRVAGQQTVSREKK